MTRIAVSSYRDTMVAGHAPSAEGLLVEAEQFARVAPTPDLREGLDAWLARRESRHDGSWTHMARPDEARRASSAPDQGDTTKRPFMLGWKRQK